MNGKAELMILNYPQKVKERDCLRSQLRNFKGVTEQEILESMNFSAPSGDRVQTSEISDKTSSIALSYRERADRINRDWIEHLVRKLAGLEEELDFFHAAIASLPDDLGPFMYDLAIKRLTWDNLEAKYHISRYTVSKYRRKAIFELDALYAAHEREVAAYILS